MKFMILGESYCPKLIRRKRPDLFVMSGERHTLHLCDSNLKASRLGCLDEKWLSYLQLDLEDRNG